MTPDRASSLDEIIPQEALQPTLGGMKARRDRSVGQGCCRERVSSGRITSMVWFKSWTYWEKFKATDPASCAGHTPGDGR